MQQQRRSFLQYAAVGGAVVVGLGILRREMNRKRGEEGAPLMGLDAMIKSMKALAVSQHGAQLQFVEVGLPKCGDNDVLVRVMATGVNPVDWKKVNSKPPGTPVVGGMLIPGWDGAGIVVNVGKKAAGKWRVGECVVWMGAAERNGTYAEYAAVDADVVGRMPQGFSYEEAAGIPLAGLTAIESIVECMGCPVVSRAVPELVAAFSDSDRRRWQSRTRTILIIGAAGGVGSWAVQIASKLCGMEVTATASTSESTQWCLKMGAARVIAHDAVSSLPASSMDCVLALTENIDLNVISRVIRPFGKVCLVVGGEAIKSVDLGLLFFKRATVSMEVVFGRTRNKEEPARQGFLLSQMARALERKALVPVTTNVLPWTKVSEAHEASMGGHVIGKTVLVLQTQEERDRAVSEAAASGDHGIEPAEAANPAQAAGAARGAQV